MRSVQNRFYALLEINGVRSCLREAMIRKHIIHDTSSESGLKSTCTSSSTSVTVPIHCVISPAAFLVGSPLDTNQRHLSVRSFMRYSA